MTRKQDGYSLLTTASSSMFYSTDTIAQKGSELAGYLLVHLDPSFATGWNAATQQGKTTWPSCMFLNELFISWFMFLTY